MVQLAARSCRAIFASLPRLWWGLLLAIHLPVLGAVCWAILDDGASPGRVGNLIALVVTMAFFALKLQDVAFLRLRTRQQSFVVVCLLTAVFHHNAVAPDADTTVLVQGAAALVTTGAVREWLRQRPVPSTDWATRLAASLGMPRLPLAVTRRRRRNEAWSPPRWLIPQSHSVPRAPPA
jgi:hypothetical protein